MREFQSWPQNSNRTAFDHLFGNKNRQKFAKYGILPIFGSFWAKKGSNVVLFKILIPDSESSHHLASFRTPCVIFTFWIFGLPCYLTKKRWSFFFYIENVHFDQLIVISVKKNASDRGGDRAFSHSCTNRTNLMYSTPFPPLLTCRPTTITSKPMQQI